MHIHRLQYNFQYKYLSSIVNYIFSFWFDGIKWKYSNFDSLWSTNESWCSRLVFCWASQQFIKNEFICVWQLMLVNMLNITQAWKWNYFHHSGWKQMDPFLAKQTIRTRKMRSKECYGLNVNQFICDFFILLYDFFLFD